MPRKKPRPAGKTLAEREREIEDEHRRSRAKLPDGHWLKGVDHIGWNEVPEADEVIMRSALAARIMAIARRIKCRPRSCRLGICRRSKRCRRRLHAGVLEIVDHPEQDHHRQVGVRADGWPRTLFFPPRPS